MSRFPAALAAMLACTAAGTAMAQPRPTYLPTRDVTVTYSYSGTGRTAHAPNTMRIAIAAGGTRARIEPEGLPGYMIMDRAHNHLTMVMAAQRMYLDMPGAMDRANEYLLDDRMRFTRDGSDTVAGYRCTIWHMTSDHGSGTGCITDDGVILSGESTSKDGSTAHVVATAVAYGPLDDGLFAPPVGFQRLEIPHMPAGAAGMPPRR